MAALRFIPAPAGNAPHHRVAGRRDSVHPRACGERDRIELAPRASAGSSPRLRGTRPNRFSRSSIIAVHPRACGERDKPKETRLKPSGSSPRLRGTLRKPRCDRSCCWFIPAPAGNARFPAGARQESAVHPRACGERDTTAGASSLQSGSSPRLRGTREGGWLVPREQSVHPRACGERMARSRNIKPGFGSSPRLRGTRCRTCR